MSKTMFSGVGITQARGKVGNDVLFRNRGGAVSRSYAIPTLVQNTFTSFVRDGVTTFSQLWRTLSESERLSWINGAKECPIHNSMGQLIFLSGFSLFMQRNQNLNLIGFAPVTTYPGVSSIPIWSAHIVSPPVGSAIQVQWQSNTVNWHRITFCTRPLSAGIFNFKKYLAFTQQVSHSANQLQTLNLIYNNRFGVLPTSGEKVGISCFITNDQTGIKSPVLMSSAIF